MYKYLAIDSVCNCSVNATSKLTLSNYKITIHIEILKCTEIIGNNFLILFLLAELYFRINFLNSVNRILIWEYNGTIVIFFKSDIIFYFKILSLG